MTMDYTVAEIKSLMIEKLDNHIDPADELLLQRLIAEEESVQAMWTEMQQLFATGDGREMMDRLNTADEWEALQAAVRKAKRRRAIIYTGCGTAVAAAVIAVLLYLRLPSAVSHPPTVAATPKGVLLEMDNGHTVDLSDKGNEAIVAGDAQLHNNGKVLTLQSGHSTAWSKITIPPGMDYQVKLSDSSILWLNAATTARFPVHFSGSTREIEVHGEAYLQVAKDPSRPFIVHLPGADVQVLGTAFNINSYDSAVVKVALVEGSVNMRTAGETVGLKPGHQALAAGTAPIKVAPFDQQQVLSWMKGQYVFYNAPVAEIAATLKRWYDVEVVMDNAAVGRKCFTGIINKQKKLENFLSDLTETAEVGYYFEGAVLHFK
jgi:ferric-dicitrate binding protein FerR (iron transport regulator)